MIKNKAILGIILAIAISLRLFFVFIYPQSPIEADAQLYDTVALNLVEGKGFVRAEGRPEIHIGPAYPFILSTIYSLFGHSYNQARFFQVLLSILTVILIYLIAKEIFSPQIGLIAAFLMSIYPAFLSYNGVLLTETIFTFCISLFIYLFMHFMKRPRLWIIFIIGLASGCTILLREEFILFLPALFLLDMPFFRIGFRKVLLIALVSLAVVAPWTIRNYKLTGEFHLVSAHIGDTLWISTYKEEWLEWNFDDPYYKKLTDGVTDFQRRNLFVGEGIKNIKEHPYLYVKFCLKRFFRFWIGSHSNTFYHLRDSFTNYIYAKDYAKVAVKAILLIFNTSLVLFGFGGIVMAIRRMAGQRRKEIILLLMPIAIIMTVHFFLFATVRYQVPIMPLMIIFASYSYGVGCVK